MNISWGSVADWAQAISSTVVLVFIYMQMRQVNNQMLQNDEYEKYRRSWEFVTFCRNELRDNEQKVCVLWDSYEEVKKDPSSSDFELLICHYFNPRFHIFVLLNQLIQHQEVDERVLYGYLEEDFNRFVELGIIRMGHQGFTREVGPKIDLLLTLWGSNAKLKPLLFATPATPAQV
ncbi:MAG TPA: hypothetical protein V6C69_02060 [Trichormus sp.]|jgi:hypothetical protein